MDVTAQYALIVLFLLTTCTGRVVGIHSFVLECPTTVIQYDGVEYGITPGSSVM